MNGSEERSMQNADLFGWWYCKKTYRERDGRVTFMTLVK
jgi:hypothetical protein